MHASVPFPATFFSLHFVDFLFRIYCIYYSFIFSALSRKKKPKTACAGAQAAFLRSSGLSVKEIAKSLKKTEQRVNNWSKRQAKEARDSRVFFFSFFLFFFFDELYEKFNRNS